MYPCFDTDGISLEELLREWKWLVPGDFRLVAVNAFGDLFLKDCEGVVHRLDIAAGTVSAIANSEEVFRFAANDLNKKREWFLIDEAEGAERKGYTPRKGQCVGSKIPWVFKESASVPDNLCVAELYEYVSFMGDLHSQMNDVPNGGQVRIKIQPRLVRPGPEEN